MAKVQRADLAGEELLTEEQAHFLKGATLHQLKMELMQLWQEPVCHVTIRQWHYLLALDEQIKWRELNKCRP